MRAEKTDSCNYAYSSAIMKTQDSRLCHDIHCNLALLHAVDFDHRDSARKNARNTLHVFFFFSSAVAVIKF